MAESWSRTAATDGATRAPRGGRFKKDDSESPPNPYTPAPGACAPSDRPALRSACRARSSAGFAVPRGAEAGWMSFIHSFGVVHSSQSVVETGDHSSVYDIL